jgi:hypothetical protein
MQDLLAQLTEQVRQYVPNLLAAIAILVLGWFAALVIGAMVRGAINRLTRGKKLPETAEGARPLPVGAWTGRVVFWILMIFVLAAAFQALQLPALVGPLDSMLQQVTQFLPQLAGAAILLAIAWAIGAALRFVVVKALERTGVERRVEESTGLKTERPLSQTLGEVVFWLPMLLFVPAVLGVLELQGLLTPLQGMFDDLLGVLPNLLGAALIMLIGWFMAKILRQIVTALLSAAGADRVGERIGMGPEAGNRRLSAVVGLVVYALILIPAAIAALDALQIDAVSQPATLMLNQVLSAVPMLFGAAIVLGVAYLVGRLLSSLVANVLEGVGFDTLFEKLGLKTVPEERATPSEIAGYLVLVAILLLAAIEATNLLGFVALSELVTEFFAFGARLLLGLVIFGVGLYLGNLAYRVIPRGAGRWGDLYAWAARIAIIVLAAAMALQHVGVAEDIVTLAFGLVLGAIAVAAAIAFGLGGKDAASETVTQWLKERG